MKTRNNYSDTDQPQLAECMLALGYRSDQSGVCKGIAITGIKDFLIDKLDHFDRCIDLLYGDEIISSDERIDLLAHLDSIEIFQQPYFHRYLFDKPLSSKDIDKVALLVSSDKTKKQGEFVKVTDWRMIYTPLELASFCDILNNKAVKFAQENKVNFAISLDNLTHMVGLCYDHVKNTWILIDSLQLPSKEISPTKLTETMHTIFQSKTGAIGLETSVFSTAENLASIKEMIKTLKCDPHFKNIHLITPEKTKRQTSTGLTLAHFAASSGKDNEMKILATNTACLNQASEVGFTPAFLAAQNGMMGVLHFLEQQGIDFNKSVTKQGRNLAYIAAERDQLTVLRWLAKKKIPLNQADNHGWTPLHIATKEGFVDVIRFLVADNKISVDQPTLLGSTPEKIAKKYQQDEAIRFFNPIKTISLKKPSSDALELKR